MTGLRNKWSYLLICVLLFAIAVPAIAYNFYPGFGHMPSTTVKWYSLIQNSSLASGWSSGVTAWNNAATVITLVPGTSSNSILYAYDYNDPSDTARGTTYHSPDETAFTWTRVDIWFNAATLASKSASIRQYVAAHEIGHALGLAPGPWGSLMYEDGSDSYKSTYNYPQNDDKVGIHCMYVLQRQGC